MSVLNADLFLKVIKITFPPSTICILFWPTLSLWNTGPPSCLTISLLFDSPYYFDYEWLLSKMSEIQKMYFNINYCWLVMHSIQFFSRFRTIRISLFLTFLQGKKYQYIVFHIEVPLVDRRQCLGYLRIRLGPKNMIR